ncbi:hypothetical protein BH20ACT24_BH20ACT24_12540 [soil metagenome]
MSTLVLLTFVAAGLLVAALAIYLITVILILRNVRQTAGLILFGVRAIADQAAPVAPIVGEINADLTGVRDGLAGILGAAGKPMEPQDTEGRTRDIIEPVADQPGPDTTTLRGTVRSVIEKAKHIAPGG